MHKGKNAVNRCALLCKPIRALTLLCLLLSVTACNSVPRSPAISIVTESIPESLTNPTPTPALRTPVTWGGIALWSDQLRDALDTCNDDKAAIGDLYLRRLQRINAAAQSAH